MQKTLNIAAGSADLRAREISNFAIRPFVLDGIECKSVEGFIQGVKFPQDDARREATFALSGVKAKNMGQETEHRFVWWDGEQIDYGSTAHHKLIERAIRASFEQNPFALAILRATRGLTLTHDTGTPESPDTSLPAAVFCDILTRLRDEDDFRKQRLQAEWLGLIPPLTLADAQVAARLIEIDGTGAYHTVANWYGRDVALLLVTAHIRRNLGSTTSYPPDPAIDETVLVVLTEAAIPTR